MEEKLKAFVQERLDVAQKYAETAQMVHNYESHAFGVVMFCMQNNLVDNLEIGNFWDDMWCEFELLKERMFV